MTAFSAEDGALKKGADLTRAAHGDLTKEVNSLPAKVATKGAWEGSSAGAFTNLITAWNNDSRRILEALETFESNLRGVDVNYTDSDQINADVMRKMAGGLSGA